ncbi:MAG: cytochrome C oxidase subunit IV family protein [Acidobacteriota bacterium]|nr:cytochrome C oxidase subunit IV family protein [Acidobacteriota bacterium]
MSEHKHPNYMAIFWILLAVTVVEVGYSLLPVPRGLLITGLVALAGFKALLVALYFMHLKFEPKSLGIIVASTLILGAILVSVGMAEHALPRP